MCHRVMVAIWKKHWFFRCIPGDTLRKNHLQNLFYFFLTNGLSIMYKTNILIDSDPFLWKNIFCTYFYIDFHAKCIPGDTWTSEGWFIFKINMTYFIFYEKQCIITHILIFHHKKRHYLSIWSSYDSDNICLAYFWLCSSPQEWPESRSWLRHTNS